MRDKFIGTWKLVAAVNEDAATGEKTDLFGPDPIGYLSYGADGRMMAIQVRSDRKKPAAAVPTAAEADALFKSLLSYAGTYTIDGNEVTHHVDISWNESWTGTRLTRKFRLEGNRLICPCHPHPTRSTAAWACAASCGRSSSNALRRVGKGASQRALKT